MTPAVKLLERLGLPHQVLTYEHDPGADGYGIEAADALGVSPEQVFKTLVAAVDRAKHVVGVVPVSAKLDLKAIAGAAGGKKAVMAERADAERLTGYVVGGISPLGQKKRLDTFVDVSARNAARIYVSGGRRGLEIELAPDDLVEAVGGRFAPIATG
jgi:Cys-tRNA(Pro)/Cys-tRNA(Cys) deacylase